MSRTSDILSKAQSLREKHQNDIDKKLIVDMQAALRDTKSFVNQRVNTISNDMQQEIEQTQQNLQDNLKHKKISLQTNIDKMGQSLSEDTKKMQESLQIQIQSLKKDLQKLNALSQTTAEQAKLKKALFSSNIVLASIALILLITSISFAYVSKSKYNDIQAMKNQVNYLKSQGGSMITTTCGGKLCVELDPNHLQDNYSLDNGTRPLGIVKEVR